MKNGLLIYSGGLDSTVLLHRYKEDIATCVYFNYGSNHYKKEIVSAKSNCDQIDIPLVEIDLTASFKHIKSGLLNDADSIPDGHYEDETMKDTVVPFRNGIMLSIAAGITESMKLDTVFIANHAGDHVIYPDCRWAFIDSISIAISLGTYTNIKIESPFCNLTKRGIARRGHSMGINLSRTWSCYKGGDIHCGTCGTCVERKEAMEGFDNTEYLK